MVEFIISIIKLSSQLINIIRFSYSTYIWIKKKTGAPENTGDNQ